MPWVKQDVALSVRYARYQSTQAQRWTHSGHRQPVVYLFLRVLSQEADRQLFRMRRPDTLTMRLNPLLNLILLKIVTSNCTLICTFSAPLLQQRYRLPTTLYDISD